ncbi:hypothetical protein BS47DRAFT_1365377 [Hydnum rufescens UP504]|uniref:Uncharacterized protein n=1 Tax=Hydnum rufescens UP504 TaxID=1448309 RepID=A0A9P6APJ5_9AGAM|nr:hypothetical protein BS47DRAFT_1365377 [Hydnum rufescens UP504]
MLAKDQSNEVYGDYQMSDKYPAQTSHWNIKMYKGLILQSLEPQYHRECLDRARARTDWSGGCHAGGEGDQHPSSGMKVREEHVDRAQWGNRKLIVNWVRELGTLQELGLRRIAEASEKEKEVNDSLEIDILQFQNELDNVQVPQVGPKVATNGPKLGTVGPKDCKPLGIKDPELDPIMFHIAWDLVRCHNRLTRGNGKSFGGLHRGEITALQVMELGELKGGALE